MTLTPRPHRFKLGAITYVIGFILYYGAMAYRKSHGIDLDLVFKEIPPE